jgi:hypothetical protein
LYNIALYRIVLHATTKLLSNMNPLSLSTQSKVRVLRAASREKCLVFKKKEHSKIVVRSVFFFNIVRNNGRKIKSFFKNSGM